MSAPKWERHDGFWLYPLEDGEYVIDEHKGGYLATYQCVCESRNLGPIRKKRETALNDCKRDNVKRRAERVQFARAKLNA